MTEEQIKQGTLILNKIKSHNIDVETLQSIKGKRINSLTFYLSTNLHPYIYGENISIDCMKEIIELIEKDIKNNIEKLEKKLLEL